MSRKRSFCQAAVALLAACKQPPAATAPSRPAGPPGIASVSAPAALAAPEAPHPAGADTVAPSSIRVGGQPLVVRRGALGPPDSTYAATTPASDPLYCFGDTQLLENYTFARHGAACYWQRGDTLTFTQTYPGAALRVAIGPRHLTERTTLAELARWFPASYRHARQREAHGRQLLLLYPPAATAPDTWYALAIEHGHLAQFFHVFNCTYD